ncbi:hypothetical protein [Pseudodesulfovibrio sp.]|uniref:hypothetical protein n=1 Tax=Pseudodesulfovibrio sp. TaxID=2035812 RepID=UPI002604CDB8|nr:hypothetical protein [Pseudodesulfovibrio sp.]MDD3311337.1 hypothetical protein [Pseudodesulfovibrio sp.]
MEHVQSKQPVKDNIKWLRQQRENPAWGKEKTPVEKVQGVTEPVAESVVQKLVELGLEGSSSSLLRTLGLGLEAVGPIADVLLSSEDAW